MRAASVLLVAVTALLATVSVSATVVTCDQCPQLVQLTNDVEPGTREGPISLTGLDGLKVVDLGDCKTPTNPPSPAGKCNAHFEVEFSAITASKPMTIFWSRQANGQGTFAKIGSSEITRPAGTDNPTNSLDYPVTYAENNKDVFQATLCFTGLESDKCTISNPAPLNFINKPLPTPVADVSVFEGQTATFSTTARGTVADPADNNPLGLTYEWQEYDAGTDSWLPVFGAPSQNTLTIGPVVAADNGRKFRAHVGDNYLALEDYTDSAFGTLTVRTRNGPLHIDVHPVDVTVQAPADCDATFTVEASGGVEPLHYQWQVRRCDQEDGDGKFDDAYQYQPKRDTDGDGNESEVEGESSERDGDRHGDYDRHDRDGDRDGWEGRVCGPNDGFINIDGATLATYKFGTSASDHKRYYRVVVHDSATPTADHVISHEVYLNVQFAPVFIKQVKDQSVREGRATSFPFKSESNPVASVRWQVAVKGETDANGDMVFTDVHNGYFASRYFHVHAEDATTVDGNYYRVVLTNALGSAISDAGKLTVIPKATITRSVDWQDEDDEHHHHHEADRRQRDSGEDEHEYGRDHHYDSRRNRLALLQAKIQKSQ